MLNFINKAAELINRHGRFFSETRKLHPLNDPEVWRTSPMYSPPADVDIAATQKWMNDLMGRTRNNQSIYKLVWSGDRSFWYEFFMQWDSLGKPSAPPVRRPRIRYKAFRDAAGRLIRDVFPPRWLIFSRLEPEQYAHCWERESFVDDYVLAGMRTDEDGQVLPDYRWVKKQIRPATPPEVFWLWYATIGVHNDYCCVTAAKNREVCYGEYAPPNYFRPNLEIQARADKAVHRPVFQRIDYAFASQVEDQNTGYALEMRELEIESEVYIEHPMALLGIVGSLKADVNEKQARQMVKDYYDREKEAMAKLV